MAQRGDLVWGNIMQVVRRCHIPPQVVRKCVTMGVLEPHYDYVELEPGHLVFNLPRLSARREICIRVYCSAYGRPLHKFQASQHRLDGRGRGVDFYRPESYG